jgi:hypothetical protein
MKKIEKLTPKPDGHFKHYFLRGLPTMKTAHEAIAWTFDKSPSKYCPEFES